MGLTAIKLYIAGPMSGLPEFNYPAFHAAIDELSGKGYVVYSPTDSEFENDGERFGKPKSWYMRRGIKMVCEVEGIALLPGWETSPGTALEISVGQMLDLDIRPIDQWETV